MKGSSKKLVLSNILYLVFVITKCISFFFFNFYFYHESNVENVQLFSILCNWFFNDKFLKCQLVSQILLRLKDFFKLHRKYCNYMTFFIFVMCSNPAHKYFYLFVYLFYLNQRVSFFSWHYKSKSTYSIQPASKLCPSWWCKFFLLLFSNSLQMLLAQSIPLYEKKNIWQCSTC